MRSLTFAKLRRINAARCEKHFHDINIWSETAWATALAGETGEFCNWIKKRHRILNGDAYQGRAAKKPKKALEALRQECKKELGDIIAYADLNATALGLTLEECVRDKFNEISKRVGSKHRL